MKNYRQMTVAQLEKELTKHYKQVKCFYDDPMTEEMGATTGDFQEDFDRKERCILAAMLDKCKSGSRNWNRAFAHMEKFMP